MSDPEKIRPVHFIGIQEEENITAADYEKAIANLERFTLKDTGEIITLDDLAFEMRFVGLGLRAVIVSNGKLYEQKHIWQHPTRGEIDAINRRHAIEKPLNDRSIILADIRGEFVRTQQKRKVAEATVVDFDFSLPFTRAISIGTAEHNIWIAHAVDFREQTSGRYYPANSPDDTSVLQGYARVVQDGVKGVLAIIPPPTSLPFAIE